jgi:hypothetical protein
MLRNARPPHVAAQGKNFLNTWLGFRQGLNWSRSGQSGYIHTRTVTDDDIARLACKPLHPLTLGDLVKSVIPSSIQPHSITDIIFLDMDVHHSAPKLSSKVLISRCQSYLHGSRIVSSHFVTFHL